MFAWDMRVSEFGQCGDGYLVAMNSAMLARSKNAAKRGGGAAIVPLETNLDFSPEKASIIVALDDALNTLALTDEEKARMVELHYFAGMTAEEVAGFLSTSVHKVRHGLRIALALLHREVNGP